MYATQLTELMSVFYVLLAKSRAEDDHDGYGNDDDDDDDVARDDVPMMLLELCRRAPEVRHMLWQPRLDLA